MKNELEAKTLIFLRVSFVQRFEEHCRVTSRRMKKQKKKKRKEKKGRAVNVFCHALDAAEVSNNNKVTASQASHKRHVDCHLIMLPQPSFFC